MNRKVLKRGVNMPKIIENLEEEITKSSLNLFKNSSYKDVSMRKIADEVGIAVGTLYNYYPNKWELYIEVFEESWRESYYILKENCKKSTDNFLLNYLKILYSEMNNKKFIVRELYRYIINDLEIDEEAEKEQLRRVRFPKVLINQIYELFTAILEKEFELKLKKDDGDLYRLFAMIQTDIPILQQNFKNKEKNIQFLFEIISSYIENNFKN